MSSEKKTEGAATCWEEDNEGWYDKKWETQKLFFYFLSFLKLSCFSAKNEVKPRLWEKDQIVEEMKIKTKDKKEKEKKRIFPPKIDLKYSVMNSRSKKVKLLRSKFKCTKNDPRFATVHDEKNILHLISTHLKNIPCSKKQILF